MKVILLLVLLAMALQLEAGPLVILTNKKGKALEAELLAADETSVKVRRKSDKKIFDLPLISLDERSVALIEKHREKLGEAYPEYDSTVVIGKRNRPKGQSSYMKIQTVTATAKITNVDRDLHSPKVNGRVVFVGQDQRTPDMFMTLATRDFEISPAPQKTIELQLASFQTEYDSDNEGYGNAGGYKYEGYLLLLFGKDQNPLHHQTTSSRLKKAIANNGELLSIYQTIGENVVINKDFMPFKKSKTNRRDVINITD